MMPIARGALWFFVMAYAVDHQLPWWLVSGAWLLGAAEVWRSESRVTR
jgi:hypothetical protein